MKAILMFRFFCMRLPSADLFLRPLWQHSGHRAARHLDLYVVRLDAQEQRIVVVDRHNGAHDAAAGDHVLAVLQLAEHLLLLLLLALHGKEQEEIEDGENEEDGQEAHDRVSRTRHLEQEVQNHNLPLAASQRSQSWIILVLRNLGLK